MITPIQEMINKLESLPKPSNGNTRLLKAAVLCDLHELLAKEKQVIINANRSGVDMVVDKEPFITGEKYFNNTFKDK